MKNLSPLSVPVLELLQESIACNLALIVELERIHGTSATIESLWNACRLMIVNTSAEVPLYNQQQMARLAGCHRAYLDTKHKPAHITRRLAGKLYGASCLDTARMQQLLKTLYRGHPRPFTTIVTTPPTAPAPTCASLAPRNERKGTHSKTRVS